MSQSVTVNPAVPAKIPAEYCWCLIWRMTFLSILPLLLSSCAIQEPKPFDLGHWTRTQIEQLQNEVKDISDPAGKITLISATFLKTPYRGSTLIGSSERDEVFVLRLDGVDCFTFLDYVEALRRSTNFTEFERVLRQIRYTNGEVTFLQRHHFFSAWGNTPFAPLRDVTSQVGGSKTRWVVKQLNQKGDGTLYLAGYPVKKQVIAFIPPETIDLSILDKLHSGDYVGIYSPLPGLDVSHTGIIIKKKGETFLRHASSKRWRNRVIDEKLLPYLGGKKGLVVYRSTTSD